MPLVTPQAKNRIILGLMTFGKDPAAGGRITTLPAFTQCLGHFPSRGYNEVDTARAYGGTTQESFTADAGWKERGLTLATKLYPHTPGVHRPENVRKQLERSLKEMRTESVDIFYLHAADRSLPFEVTLEECDRLHKEGKFSQLGLSNFTGKDYGW